MDFNTGPGSGSSSPTPGSAPGPRSRGTGGEFTLQDPVGSFVRTVMAVATRPVPFFRGIARQGDFVNPLVFALVCTLISALIGGIIGILLSPLFAAPGDTGEALVGGVGGFLGGLILAPIYTALVVAIGAGILHLLVLLLVKPSNGGFEATFRVVSYSWGVTRLVSWIPILGWIVAPVWATVLYILGIREVHSTSTGKAALVVLIPVGVILLLILLVGAALTALFFGSQQF